MEHRDDCQLLTVPTYGLCTCDMDERCAMRDFADAHDAFTAERDRDRRPNPLPRVS